MVNGGIVDRSEARRYRGLANRGQERRKVVVKCPTCNEQAGEFYLDPAKPVRFLGYFHCGSCGSKTSLNDMIEDVH